jgi:hypothetical protein
MRKVLLLIFILGLVGSANAQFGIRAGFSSANFSKSDFSSIGAFHIGGYYHVKLDSELVSIEPGIQYSGKGYSTAVAGTADLTEKLGYIDVPVLVRVKALASVPSLNIFAGPQASLLVSRTATIGDKVTSTSLEPVRGYELGAVVGVGVNVASGVNFQASYDLGLTSLNYFDTKTSNRVLKFSLGYTFGK